jgi:hypothetical protein
LYKIDSKKFEDVLRRAVAEQRLATGNKKYLDTLSQSFVQQVLKTH